MAGGTAAGSRAPRGGVQCGGESVRYGKGRPMKRVNIRDAFVGEPNRHQEGLSNVEDEGLEALLLAVRGGEVTVVLPAGTDAAAAIQGAECLRGVLRLEHERVLTFEIQAAATGAFFEDEPAALYRRRRAAGGGDLSAIEATHDYMAAGGAPAPAGGAPPTRARDAMTLDPVTARPDLPVRPGPSCWSTTA